MTSDTLGQGEKSQLINSKLYVSEAKTKSAIEISSPAMNSLSFKKIVSILSKAVEMSFLAYSSSENNGGIFFKFFIYFLIIFIKVIIKKLIIHLIWVQKLN